MRLTLPDKPARRGMLAAKGFCMGAADIIPGVSGGTMAFILGIYPQFIAAIRSFDFATLQALLRLDFKTALARPHFGFILPLALGIVAALLFFTRVVELPQLLLRHPEEIYGLFFGLIAGSLLVLLRDLARVSVQEIIMLAAGAGCGLFVFNLVPAQTPDAAWFLFSAGALSICAMMLPGVSGSFVLLVLNKYAYVFDAIGYGRLSVLLPFAAGAAAGLVCFSRLLAYILKHYYRLTVVFISGLLAASLSVIWPFRERGDDAGPGLAGAPLILPGELSRPVALSLALAGLGFLLVWGLARLRSPR